MPSQSESTTGEASAPNPEEEQLGTVSDTAAEATDETSDATEPSPVADQSDEGESQPKDDTETVVGKRHSNTRLAIAVGAAILVALGSLTGWLGYRMYQSRQAETERDIVVAVARQGAINLTTIDHNTVDADIKRILDSSTGTFHDDFQTRSEPFVAVVKQAQSKSTGTVTESALESQDGDQAQVLVAVSVKTSTAAQQEQDPRRWRMRITVEKSGDSAKVSDVQFVP